MGKPAMFEHRWVPSAGVTADLLQCSVVFKQSAYPSASLRLCAVGVRSDHSCSCSWYQAAAEALLSIVSPVRPHHPELGGIP